MSIATDTTDARTLAYIGRNPGAKRSSTWVCKAAVNRLIRAGLLVPPNTSGRLYLTEAGTEAHWAPAARPQPVNRELFDRTAPAWNCVDYPGDGMHLLGAGGGCRWCGHTREQIAAERTTR